MPASIPQPRAYTFKQAEALTTFARATWYRWENQGLVRLIRVANKTLVPAEEIERIAAVLKDPLAQTNAPLRADLTDRLEKLRVVVTDRTSRTLTMKFQYLGTLVIPLGLPFGSHRTADSALETAA